MGAALMKDAESREAARCQIERERERVIGCG
jgi:hypothetical protein